MKNETNIKSHQISNIALFYYCFDKYFKNYIKISIKKNTKKHFSTETNVFCTCVNE